MFRRIIAAVTMAFSGPALCASAESVQTIIVLDASGSMWGQIDGVAKIDIAKKVIEDLLETLDPKLELER